MTVTINGTTGIDKVQDGSIQAADLASGVPSRSQLPAGTVLQVVNATYSTQTSSSSSTYADTGLTATITPTSATSKILVLVEHTGLSKNTGNTFVLLRLVRNSTTLITTETQAGWNATSTGVQNIGGSGMNYLDSPATTSATTYKTQFASGTNIASVIVGETNTTSTITLMEIAA